MRSEIKTAPLSEINTIFANLKAGKIEGRMVLDIGQSQHPPNRELRAYRVARHLRTRLLHPLFEPGPIRR